MVRQAVLAPLVAGAALLLSSAVDAFVPHMAAKPRFGFSFGSRGGSSSNTARQVSSGGRW